MLASLFQFRGRIGRLRYFLSCMALGPALLFTLVALMFAFGLHPGGGATNEKAVILAALIVLPLFCWTSLSLQACRFRDIGWNPALFILGWIGIEIVDTLFATAAPQMSLGPIHHTLIGVAANLGLGGALLFWPGDGGEGGEIASTFGPPAAPATPGPAAPIGRPAPAFSAAVSTGFGRRGL